MYIYNDIYNQTGSYIAVEVAEVAIFAVGTLWMMWVIRSYKLKKPSDEEQQQKVFKFKAIPNKTHFQSSILEELVSN